MVQIIPASKRKPSFSESLSQGVGRGLEMGSQMMQQSQNKQAQVQALQQLGIDPSVLGLPEQAQAEYFKQAFAKEKGMTPLQEAQMNLANARTKQAEGQQELFQQFTKGNQRPDFGKEVMGNGNTQEQPQGSQEGGFDLKSIPEDKLRQLASFAGQPGEAGVIGQMAKGQLDKIFEEKKIRTDKEKQFFKMNEPKLMEISDTLNKLEMEDARYDRLNTLFSDPSKFPSSLTAAIFSKDGQINDLVYSQLTPEAQESIKLIIDSTSNIKDTYGARVTNFDLQTYLKKLPSLLNSPEGKMRVLRDLKIMNQLNQMHARGIQKIFEDAGGSDKIPYSTAEAKYKKEFGKQEKELRDKFINPEKGTFKDLPSAEEFLGRKIKNPDTGEIFISDGTQWKPIEE